MDATKRLTKAQQRKQDKALPALAEVMLIEHGAIKGATHSTGSMEFLLPTSAGAVTVWALEGWIHVRVPMTMTPAISAAFHDKPSPGGKWNIHGSTNEGILMELDIRLGWLTQYPTKD